MGGGKLGVDFGRELRDGDGFYVRWEQQFSIEGAPIGVGRVLWAELKASRARETGEVAGAISRATTEMVASGMIGCASSSRLTSSAVR